MHKKININIHTLTGLAAIDIEANVNYLIYGGSYHDTYRFRSDGSCSWTT